METITFKTILEVPLEGGDFRGDYPAMAIPRPVRTSAMDALQQGQTHYVGVLGIEPLRAAVSEFLAGLGVDVPAGRVIITSGEQEARFLALQGVARQYAGASVARGDRQARFLAVHDVAQKSFRVAVPTVVAPGVKAALAVRDRQVATMLVDETAGLLSSIAVIEQALANGSNLIYLESPGRLTGFIYSPEQVQRIADLLEAYDALSIWDQGIAPAVTGEYVSLASVAPEHTIAIGMLWPGLGLANWQVGYVIVPAAYVESLTALKQVMSICTGTPGQWAAVGAAQVFAEKHGALVAEMDAVRREMLSTLSGDDRVLAGQAVSSLAMNLGDAAAKAQKQLLDKNIQVADGAAFGAPGVLRVTMKLNAQTANIICALLEGASP